MISLSILGLLQALFLPGFLVTSAMSRYRNVPLPLVNRAIIATPLSLVINYLIVFVFEISGLYVRWVMLLIIAFEVTALLVLTWKKPFSSSEPRTFADAPPRIHVI